MTPPSFATHVAAGLTNARLMELPNAGHGGKTSFPCVLDAEVAFVDRPERPLDARCTARLPRVPFATEILVLPGLTRLLVGIQSGSHRFLTAGVTVAVLLQLVCALSGAVSLLRNRHGALSGATALRRFRWAALAAAAAALAAATVLTLDIVHSVDTNPTVLLLGLEGPQHALAVLTLIAVLLASAVIIQALRSHRVLRRSFLAWLAGVAAVGCIATSVVMVSG